MVEVLDPQAGEHVLDLCAGPGIKTGQIAARMGDRGEVISVELDPARAGEVAEQARRLGLRSVTVIEADATEMELAAGLRPRPARRALLGPRRPRLAPGRPLAQIAAAIERLVDDPGAALCAPPPRLLRPGGTLVYATCTISRRENEDRVAALLAAAAAGEVPALELEDLGARAPGLASPLEPRCLQLRPDRDRTTGFFISRLRRHD